MADKYEYRAVLLRGPGRDSGMLGGTDASDFAIDYGSFMRALRTAFRGSNELDILPQSWMRIPARQHRWYVEMFILLQMLLDKLADRVKSCRRLWFQTDFN